MASIAEVEETARDILRVCRRIGLEVGNSESVNRLYGPFIGMGRQWSEFRPGARYARQQNWILYDEHGQSLTLTDTGFAAVQASTLRGNHR
jgi:hypothetical protein